MKTNFENHAFTTHFWQSFLEKSKNLKKAIYLPKILSEDDLKRYHLLVSDIICDISAQRSSEYGFRLWIDKESESNESIAQVIYDNPPHRGELVENWANRNFLDKKFCLVINRAEHFNDSFAQQIAKLVDPLLEVIGVPPNGLTTTIFIGNYGYTPFGIHKDSQGEFPVNLHLGPGQKIMYNWNQGDSNSFQNNICENLDEYIKTSKKYHLTSGDFYFMPWDIYHLGYTQKFSVSVTIWFNYHNVRRIVKKLFSHILTDEISVKDNTQIGEIGERDPDIFFNKLTEKIKIDSDDLSLTELLRKVNKRRSLSFLSNGGFSTKPIELKSNNIFKRKKIGAVSPFKLEVTSERRACIVYARGYPITLADVSITDIEDIISLINSSKYFEFKEFIKFAPPAWDEKVCLYFLSTLYNYRAIQYVE